MHGIDEVIDSIEVNTIGIGAILTAYCGVQLGYLTTDITLQIGVIMGVVWMCIGFLGTTNRRIGGKIEDYVTSHPYYLRWK